MAAGAVGWHVLRQEQLDIKSLPLALQRLLL